MAASWRLTTSPSNIVRVADSDFEEDPPAQEESALLVGRVSDDLQAFKPQIQTVPTRKPMTNQLHSAIQALDLLEEYYKKFHKGERRTTKSAARKLHSILLKEIEMLKQFSNQ